MSGIGDGPELRVDEGHDLVCDEGGFIVARGLAD
jgi:hypothetical protein